jgi:gliding motility-associated-like protein
MLRFTILLFLLIWPVMVYAQVKADFSAPDTVCIDQPVTVTDLSTGPITSYNWNFCSANLNDDPIGQNLGNMGNLDGPAFIALVKDQHDINYAFITNFTHGTLTRLDIGKSLSNQPNGVYLGDLNGVIPESTEGIQVKYDSDNGNWYGFIVGGKTGLSKLIRINFGPNLNNPTPTTTDLGNPGNLLAFPIDLYMVEENNKWYGFTVNQGDNRNDLIRITFNGLDDNTPIVESMGDMGGKLNGPSGIMPVYEGGNWYFFITNFYSHALTRLNFGPSISNKTPHSDNFNSLLALINPFDLSIIKDCGKYFGFVLDRIGNAVRLDFPSGISGEPVVSNLNIAGLFSPHGISDVRREGDSIYLYIANSANSTIMRLFYQTCNAPTFQTSLLKQPADFAYTRVGKFNIHLIVNRGLPNEKDTCKNIVVFPKPETSLGPDTTICYNTSIMLHPTNSFRSYKWMDGSTNQTYTADSAGLVWVEAKDRYGCKATDSINISIYPKTLDLGPDVTAQRGDVQNIEAIGNFKSYHWSTGETKRAIAIFHEGKYIVSVVDQHNCIQTDDIYITYETYIPNFFTPNNDGLNDLWVIPFLKNYPDAVIKIYDRYGKLVASKKGSDLGDKGWDGNYNGAALPMDSYWYFIDLKDGSDIIKGFVTIKW